VLGESNKNVYLSSRNISNSKVVTASDLNTYDILNANNLVLVESSLKEIENLLG
jgi:large subunit ribosomal protein L4